MKKITTDRLLKLYQYLLAACILIAGVCLMLACYGIYAAGGDQPYTPETVAAAFAPIAIPVYLCLGLVVISFVLRLIFPKAYQEPPLRNQPAMTLKRMHTRRDVAAADETLRLAVRKQQRRRKLLYGLCAGVWALCSLVFLLYALNGRNYHQTEINASMLQAMKVLLPCLAVSLAMGIFVSYRSRASMVAESELLKQCPKRTEPTPAKTLPGWLPMALKLACVAVAVGLLIYGFCAGGTADVLTKAKNICTECVGLG